MQNLNPLNAPIAHDVGGRTIEPKQNSADTINQWRGRFASLLRKKRGLGLRSNAVPESHNDVEGLIFFTPRPMYAALTYPYQQITLLALYGACIEPSSIRLPH